MGYWANCEFHNMCYRVNETASKEGGGGGREEKRGEGRKERKEVCLEGITTGERML